MRVEKLKCDARKKLSDVIFSNLGLSYNVIRKIIRNKDVKINDKRVSDDVFVMVGDIVTIYFQEFQRPRIEIVYQDENVIVVYKKRSIETVSDVGQSLQSLLSEQINKDCYTVHRLDRNTEGLIIFALNQESKKELDLAFKNRIIDKYYLAIVNGLFAKKTDTLTAYLKKDSDKSLVYISDEQRKGYEKIITEYKVLKEILQTSLVEVKLVTGKTHQIRAHLSHVGHFIIGDEKYGDSKVNKIYKKKYQCLCSYKMKFNFKDGSKLYYLNKIILELEKEKIDFCQNL